MTTIPQRLREIAARLRKPRDGRPWGADDGAADLLYAIAAELEAPAADDVQSRGIQEWADSPACAGKLLVLHRDHLATVAALQARIKELERQKEIDVEQGNVSVAHYASVLRQLSDAQARINALEARQEQVRTFLDIAAGEGMELGGVDAGDLYVKIFGYPQPDTSKEQP